MKRPAHVVANEPLTSLVRRILLRVDEGTFEHSAGQAVVVELAGPDGAAIKVPYSIASGPGEHGPATFELAVARDTTEGSRSIAMHGLEVGTSVTVKGPIGTFLRSPEARRAPGLFVAAGTGLSPLRSMIAAALADPDDASPLVLLYGARNEEEILWKSDLVKWTADYTRFTVIITLSRPHDEWKGLRGRVQPHLAHAAMLAGPDAHAFVCGPEPMVTEVMSTLHTAHLPEVRVHRERYG